MKIAISLLALALTAAPAAAQQLVPPLEYDKPYTGAMIVIYARDQHHVRDLCPGAPFGRLSWALACAQQLPSYCRVVIAPDADIKAAGFSRELVVRHEMGHCNGWPGDHNGGRWAGDQQTLPAAPTNTDTPTVPLVTTVAAEFDFASRAVGKTVAEVANSLAAITLPFQSFDKPFKTLAVKFITAAKGIGLTPEAQLTRQVLSDPAMAIPLAKSVGFGTDLSDEQWRQAHDKALQTARARYARPRQQRFEGCRTTGATHVAPLRPSNPKTV